MYENDPGYPPPLPSGPPLKVCRRCSTQTASDGTHCPNCGTSYVKRGPRITKRMIAIAAVVIVIIAAGVVLLLIHNHNQDAARVAAQKSSSAAAASSSVAAAQSAADASASASAAAKRKADSSQRAIRKLEVAEMEATIKKDAIKDVNDGLLDGPIKRVECTPLGGGSTDDLTARTGTFSCIAVNKTNTADGTESGYAFSAVINWDTGEYSWHLGNS